MRDYQTEIDIARETARSMRIQQELDEKDKVDEFWVSMKKWNEENAHTGMLAMPVLEWFSRVDILDEKLKSMGGVSDPTDVSAKITLLKKDNDYQNMSIGIMFNFGIVPKLDEDNKVRMFVAEHTGLISSNEISQRIFWNFDYEKWGDTDCSEFRSLIVHREWGSWELPN